MLGVLGMAANAVSSILGGNNNSAKKEAAKPEDSSQLNSKNCGNKDTFTAYRKGMKDGLKMRESV